MLGSYATVVKLQLAQAAISELLIGEGASVAKNSGERYRSGLPDGGAIGKE